MEICTAPSSSSEISPEPNYRRPFLKWAGGKFKILDAILAALPPGERLVEPFVGSGVAPGHAGHTGQLVTAGQLDAAVVAAGGRSAHPVTKLSSAAASRARLAGGGA